MTTCRNWRGTINLAEPPEMPWRGGDCVEYQTTTGRIVRLNLLDSQRFEFTGTREDLLAHLPEPGSIYAGALVLSFAFNPA